MNRNNEFEPDDDDEDYIKPKKTFQPTRHKKNDEYERYDVKDYKKHNYSGLTCHPTLEPLLHSDPH